MAPKRADDTVAAELGMPAAGADAALVAMVREMLGDEVIALSRLLFVMHERDGFTVRTRVPGSEWVDAIDAATARAVAEIAEEERALVARAVDGLDAELAAIWAA
jgi:hypothetical protein